MTCCLPYEGLLMMMFAGLAEDAQDADPDDWDAWLRIYKEIERGREHKFGEARHLRRSRGRSATRRCEGGCSCPLAGLLS